MQCLYFSLRLAEIWGGEAGVFGENLRPPVDKSCYYLIPSSFLHFSFTYNMKI